MQDYLMKRHKYGPLKVNDEGKFFNGDVSDKEMTAFLKREITIEDIKESELRKERPEDKRWET